MWVFLLTVKVPHWEWLYVIWCHLFSYTSPFLSFYFFRTDTRDDWSATWPGDIRGHGPKLQGLMEPCPWECWEIQSGLLSFSGWRSTGGEDDFLFFFWKHHQSDCTENLLLFRSNQEKLRKQTIATNKVIATLLFRSRPSERSVLARQYSTFPLYLWLLWELSAVLCQVCSLSSVFPWELGGIIHPHPSLIPPFTTPHHISAGNEGLPEMIPWAVSGTCLIFPEHLTTETIKSFA